jgi:hypothetical protein
MDGQLSFAALDYAGKKKRTKRDVFLGREPINLSGGRLAGVRYAPITDKIARRSEMTRCATSRQVGMAGTTQS